MGGVLVANSQCLTLLLHTATSEVSGESPQGQWRLLFPPLMR